MNDFYNTPAVPVRNTLARAEQVQQQFQGVAAGFDKLPSEQRMKTMTITYGVTTGSGAAYLVTPPYPLAAYVDGQELVVKVHTSNTGPATVNVMGINGVYLGIVPITRDDGTDLEAGDMAIGAILSLRYDGARYRLGHIIRAAFTGTLPSQSGAAGKFLTTDGSTTYWGSGFALQAQVNARTSTDLFVSPATLATGLGLTGSNIASAATLTLPAVGDNFTVTGSTGPVTGISARDDGRLITLRLAADLNFTHSASLILPRGRNIVGQAGDVLTFRSIGSGWRLVSKAGSADDAVCEFRSAGSTVVLADKGKILSLSNTHTLALTAAATLGDGFWITLCNDGTGIITVDPAGVETLEGQATRLMYPNEAIYIWVSGTTWYLEVLRPYIITYTSSSSYTKPVGYRWHGVDQQPPGGGAGSGARGGSRTPATGGGGGSRRRVLIADADMPASPATVTVGAAGVGGAAVTTNDTDGNNGTDGGQSSFGGKWIVRGGSGGKKGTQGGATQEDGGDGGYPMAEQRGMVDLNGTSRFYVGNGYALRSGTGYGPYAGSETIGGGGGGPSGYENGGGSSGAGPGGGGENGSGGSQTQVTGGGGAPGVAGSDYQGGGGGATAGAPGGKGGLGSGGGAGAGANNGTNSGKGGDGGDGRTTIWGVI